ncbi:MAG: FkbM family methyltransferase [Opitutae bacterium]|nr:FkbM family methyltransferase [Opitutae bacterium]
MLRARGCTVSGLTTSALLQPEQVELDLVHINWTELLARELYFGTRWLRLTARAAGVIGEPADAVLRAAVRRRLRPLFRRHKVVYEVHDLTSNWLQPAGAHRLDRAVKAVILSEAHGWIVHEDSCLGEIACPPPAALATCRLGGFDLFHGTAISREAARASLGLPTSGRVFVYAGYSSPRRNPRELVAAFARLPAGHHLLIASSNARDFLPAELPANVRLFTGFLEDEFLRTLFSAADWTVMPGRHYLTSAVVRTAISYHSPVICAPFGSQIDMARDAALWLDDDSASLSSRLSTAATMPDAELARFREAAGRRQAERTWEKFVAAYLSLVTRLVPNTSVRLDASAPDTASSSAATPPPDLSYYLSRPSAAATEFQRLLPPSAPKVICDIGACEGEDSIRFSRLFPAARVFAFEALPSNQALVRENFARYAADRAELVPLALSDRLGTATFHVSSGRPPELFAGEDWNYGNKSSSLLPPAAGPVPMHGWIEFKERIEVPTDTLDRFCAARGLAAIDLVHMDVQGAELLVLRGAERMLPFITAIWLEVSASELYRGQALDRDITAFMRAHGFALAHVELLGNATGEGDHFYVNVRHARVWPYLAAKRFAALFSRARFSLGALKNRLLGHPNP